MKSCINSILTRLVRFQRNPLQVRWASAGANNTSAGPVAHSPHPPIQPNDSVTIPEMVRLLRGPWDEAIAFDDPTTGLKLTHAEVHRQARSFGAALLQLRELKRGDVVGVLLPNCPQYTPVFLGIWEAGLIACPFNPGYTKEEMIRQLADSGSKAVVTIPQFVGQLDSAPAIKSVIVVAAPGTTLPANTHSYAEMIKTDPTGVEFLSGSKVNTRETLALLPYSSGTTGLPKGVMISHHNMTSHLLQLTTPGLLQWTRFGEGPPERVLGLLPFFHCFGYTVFCIFAPSVGVHVHCLPKFSPPAFIQALRTHKPTILHLVPPLLAFLVASPEVGRAELESVRTIVAGAAPIGPALIQKLRDKAGHDVLLQEVYGCTELSAGATALPTHLASNKPGSCGVPFPSTDMKVLDVDSGAIVGPGQVGEICFRGPQMMNGYWRNPTATADTIRDGWLHTGDLGYYDEDKCLFIVDRMKELIKVKGFQVAPAELEDILRTHPAVADTAVIGVPDEKTGQLPRAYVVLKPGSTASEKEIAAFVEGKVTKYKELRGGVEMVDAIPKAPSGKILRRELVRAYKERQGIKN